MNTLYYGDNLKILREHLATESVDLIYLDPPFNSNRNYNVLFKNESGVEADSQIKAFDDTWHWNRAAELTYNELINEPDDVGRMIEALRGFIVGQGNYGNQMMAYLVMMAVRLKELHRVLKSTGSLYLHCDPTASHYLKILLDTIFGAENFRNEITWQRTLSKGLMFRKLPDNHDTILSYQKTNAATWNGDATFAEYNLDNLDDKTASKYSLKDSDGRRYQLTSLINPNSDRPNLTYEFLGVTKVWRWTKERMQDAYENGLVVQTKEGGVPRYKRYLDEQRGKPLGDVWTDIPPLNSQAQERLGYPTQKPVALLERIIQASSNEGDVVLDPFCGCGTTIAAAQKLNRQWIGIDITHLSTGLMKLRLRDNFGMTPLQKPARKQGHTQEKLSTPQDGSENTGSAASGIRSRSTASNPNVESTLANARASASNSTYQVIGEPEDIDGARELAATDRYDFQWWILPLIGARALGAPQGQKHGKKGADSGIDGLMVFTDDNSGKAKKVIVSVKSGGVNVSQIRDLAHVVDREKAAIGVFLTLDEPTKPMKAEAVKEGFYHSPGWNKDYPKLQILTVEEILAGKSVDLPPNITTFKRAGKIEKESDDQHQLGFE